MSRFNFLIKDYPSLYRLCAGAEQYAPTDITITMLKERQALENIIHYLHCEQENLFSSINYIQAKQIANDFIISSFHFVRQFSNHLHWEENFTCTKETLENSFNSLFKITVWMAIEIGNHLYKEENFDAEDWPIVNPVIIKTQQKAATTLQDLDLEDLSAVEEFFFKYSKETREKFLLLQTHAKQGDMQAQNELGDEYSFINDRHISRVCALEALKWYRKAAAQGHAKAMVSIGEAYIMGDGVDIDDEEAAKWYHKAAILGDVYAQLMMGEYYAEKDSIPNHQQKSFEWFKKAADQNIGEAMQKVAEMYYYGDGVEQSYAQALKYYSKMYLEKKINTLSEMYDCLDGMVISQRINLIYLEMHDHNDEDIASYEQSIQNLSKVKDIINGILEGEIEITNDRNNQADVDDDVIISDDNNLLDLIKNKNLQYVDKRDKGALWVIGGTELKDFMMMLEEKTGYVFHFKKEGSKSTLHQSAWWTK